MSKVIVVTDSNSGITPDEAKKLGVEVIPMPFYIDEQMYYENIDLTQEQFYEKLTAGGDIKTSMPLVGDVTDKWDEFLKENDEIVYIPMSSGLSSSCETAYMLSQDYDGKVQVVNNQRISVTMRQSVIDAKNLAEAGKNAAEIKQILEDAKFESSIYIMVDTLNYLKKGGRITPAAAALGTLLKLKPVLQIQGEKLDAFAKARTVKQAKSITEDTELLFDDKGIHVTVAGKKNFVSWKKIKRVSKKPTMIVVFLDTTHGYVLSNRLLGSGRDAFYEFVTSKMAGKSGR